MGGVGLRKMIQHHNDRSEAADALTSHANEMLQSSRKALQAASGSDATTEYSAKPATRPGEAELPKRDSAITTTGGNKDSAENGKNADQDLVRLARKVVDAVQGLDQEQPAGAPGSTPRSQGGDR